MARYNLIMKDSTYVKIVSQATIENVSVGKLINKILDEWAESSGKAGGVPVHHVCIVCGAKALFEGHGKGQQRLFVCACHKDYVKKLDGYLQLSP